ncbi:COG4223 family protein [Rhodopseudomonas sp. P2A-2r]|uniref:COG4223 family protein n=1 Tax=unclassified Rhodopseudomonas TaxID=2638247 RepID=UPI0022341524|nr:hypothetical protein [Rhodopseudomonas sp. P2A-2r]UZE49575.1 hypothetical protein ONR75_01695 [Rhodopseudomonas sp. P2A-2r]
MVDDRPEHTAPDLGRPDLGRPKRPPPTIDLAATEVTSETAASNAGAPEAPAETQAEPQLEHTSEPPAAAETESPAEVEAAATEPAAPPAPKSSAALAAGSGALAAAVVVGIAWFAGWQATPSAPEAPQANSMALDALSARIARVESRPAPTASPGAAAAPDPALAARLDALEKSVTALRSDLAAISAQSERAAAAVADLKSAPPAAAPPVNLAPINDRLSKIERAATALRAEAAQQAAKPADDRPLRRVVAASLLDGTLRQSEPYAAQLGAAKPLAEDANALKPLDAFAASGLPTAAALSRELLAVLPKLTATPEPAPTTGTGFVDRLQAGAVRLLRIERTDAVAGDDRNAIVSRATAAALRNDVASARRELNALQPADRGAVQAWIDKVDARDAALAASRQFAADAMAALNKPAP